MTDHQTRRRWFSRLVTESGAEHALLSYEYLDSGDIDGYGSLLADDVALDRPDTPPSHGRAEVIRMLTERVIPQALHAVDHVIADGDHVVVVGRLSQSSGPFATRAVEHCAFVDVFTLSETGLLSSCRRYYSSCPAGP